MNPSGGLPGGTVQHIHLSAQPRKTRMQPRLGSLLRTEDRMEPGRDLVAPSPVLLGDAPLSLHWELGSHGKRL